MAKGADDELDVSAVVAETERVLARWGRARHQVRS